MESTYSPAADETPFNRVQRDIESSRELLRDYDDDLRSDNDVVLPRFGFSALNSLFFGGSTVTNTFTIPTSYTFITVTTTKSVREN